MCAFVCLGERGGVCLLEAYIAFGSTRSEVLRIRKGTTCSNCWSRVLTNNALVSCFLARNNGLVDTRMTLSTRLYSPTFPPKYHSDSPHFDITYKSFRLCTNMQKPRTLRLATQTLNGNIQTTVYSTHGKKNRFLGDCFK